MLARASYSLSGLGRVSAATRRTRVAQANRGVPRGTRLMRAFHAVGPAPHTIAGSTRRPMRTTGHRAGGEAHEGSPAALFDSLAASTSGETGLPACVRPLGRRSTPRIGLDWDGSHNAREDPHEHRATPRHRPGGPHPARAWHPCRLGPAAAEPC